MARLADRQHGVVSRKQLQEAGLTRSMIAVRLDRRGLIRLHRGVYAVGHRRLTRRGEWLAAVLAAGPDAALSHHSAAALHGLREERGRRVDVTTTAKRSTTNWIEVHGRALLPPCDLTTRHAIPVTTLSRTLVDLADVLSRRDLARAVNEADVLRALDVGKVVAVVERMRGRRGSGARAIRAVLEEHCGPVVLRSELEHRFRELLDAHGLPPAEHNVRIAGWEVDVCWGPAGLVVELDGGRFHRTPAKRRSDAEKEAALRAAGWRVARFGWTEVTAEPERTAAAVRALLAENGASRGAKRVAWGRE